MSLRDAGAIERVGIIFGDSGAQNKYFLDIIKYWHAIWHKQSTKGEWKTKRHDHVEVECLNDTFIGGVTMHDRDYWLQSTNRRN